MNPLTQVPALYRKYIYMSYFVIGLLLGAIQVGYATNGGQPAWLSTALVVYAYIGTGLGLTAASNVGPQDVPPPAPAK